MVKKITKKKLTKKEQHEYNIMMAERRWYEDQAHLDNRTSAKEYEDNVNDIYD